MSFENMSTLSLRRKHFVCERVFLSIWNRSKRSKKSIDNDHVYVSLSSNSRWIWMSSKWKNISLANMAKYDEMSNHQKLPCGININIEKKNISNIFIDRELVKKSTLKCQIKYALEFQVKYQNLLMERIYLLFVCI